MNLKTLTALLLMTIIFLTCGIEVLAENGTASGAADTSSGTETEQNTELKITVQPKNLRFEPGTTVTLYVKAEGTDLQYCWYYKKVGQSAFKPWKNHTNSSESVAPDKTWDGIQLYCEITDGSGNTIRSDIAEVRMCKCKKILALGDSICHGFRNNAKSFSGDLGLAYWNIGVSGATLSTARTDVINIPEQLSGVKGCAPDIIISNGGINDYFSDAPLGEIPSSPLSSAEELDDEALATVTGGLQKLFITMINKFPSAQHCFLISHKTTVRYPKTVDGATVYTDIDRYMDCTVTKNKAGYTQEELHDVIVACCNVYGIDVIDVYKNSGINTALPEYCSSVPYSEDHSATDTAFVDIDGIHPMSRGYLEGYVPVILNHIDTSQPCINLAITRQPQNISANLGDPITVSLEADGEGLKYQWYSKKAGESDFVPWPSRIRASETVTPNDSWDGIKLYCMVTDERGNSVKSDTITVTLTTRIKILALGDSICRGYRNVEKGFVGDLGLPYRNIGVSGATLSTQRTDVTPIPQQLINESGYQPDIIIADGGMNDYTFGAPMGDIPTQPADSAASVDPATVMGGLQKLFLTMKEKYPDAKPYYLITHRVCRNGIYLVTEPCSAGYTQQQLHDALAACCKVYNIEVIDVFRDSPLDTKEEKYLCKETYTWNNETGWTNAINNVTDYVNGDGVHPLTRGYLEFYVPLIRQHLDSEWLTDHLHINRQPVSQEINPGDQVTFSLKAQGQSLRYQWYCKKVGQSEFTKWKNRVRNTETLTPNDTWDGIQLYCIVTDGAGNSVQSDTVRLTFKKELAITRQPQNTSIQLGEAVNLSLTAQGTDLCYQWYYKKSGSSAFSIWKNRTHAAESVTPDASWNGIQLYCIVTDGAGNSVQSDTVTVNVTQQLAITRQPQNTSIQLGEAVNLSLKAQGIGIKYQWYYKKAGASAFSIWKNHTHAAESVTPDASWNGIQLYCIVTDGVENSVQSDTVTVTVTQQLAITRQPQNTSIQLGEAVNLSLKAQGIGIKYQWYYKKAGASAFSIWKNHTHASESVTPDASWNGIQLYCIVTDGAGNSVQSDTVTVTVTQ